MQVPWRSSAVGPIKTVGNGGARGARTHEQQVSHGLSQHGVDAEDVLQHLVEDHQGHVQLLLVEHLTAHTQKHTQPTKGLDWAVEVGGRACCSGSEKTIAYPPQ